MNTRRIALSTIVLTLFVCVSVSPVSAQLLPRDRGINPLFSKPIFPRERSTSPPVYRPEVVVVRQVEGSREEPTAENAQKWLEEGNARFCEQQRQTPYSGLSRVKETAQNGQHPFVTILSCSDSRVPLEIVFDRGIGDLFVIRVAGNVAGESETGSIEYGVEHVGTPLLVVLGHTKCGAVTAAATHAHTEGSITKLVGRIQPAVEKAAKDSPEIKDEELIKKATVENVWESVKNLMENSEIIRHLVKEKKLQVVGAIYDVETGAVEWLGEHAEMEKLIGEH